MAKKDDEEKAEPKAEPVVVESEAKKQDETIPGGKFKVGGVFVDSEGKEIK